MCYGRLVTVLHSALASSRFGVGLEIAGSGLAGSELQVLSLRVRGCWFGACGFGACGLGVVDSELADSELGSAFVTSGLNSELDSALVALNVGLWAWISPL